MYNSSARVNSKNHNKFNLIKKFIAAKDFKQNKSEMLKISKIDRKERTKSEQALFDKMADKTKELKKLEKAL